MYLDVVETTRINRWGDLTQHGFYIPSFIKGEKLYLLLPVITKGKIRIPLIHTSCRKKFYMHYSLIKFHFKLPWPAIFAVSVKHKNTMV